jgi:hypothetical protein
MIARRHHTRIARIPGDGTIEIERPLPWDLYSNFKPIAIHKFLPSIHNFGFSGFNVITRAGRYAGECGSLTRCNRCTCFDLRHIWLQKA